MSASNASAAQLAAIDATAADYGLSPTTLLGVYGAESTYGTSLGPSSAGAVGPFGFEPATGKSYGLNGKTIMQFQPSLTAAAQYLKSLGANSSPTSPATFGALNAYNDNGSGTSASGYTNRVLSYGLSSAKFKALEKSAVAAAGGGVNIPSDISGAYNAVVSPFTDVASAISWVGTNWLRIFEFLGGAVLGIFGLVLLGKAGAKEV